ncbi:MAG: D-sedoheptulose 7-phosphate isomerase [Paludibacteraceae bacterium]|nr:D-sedoheptulose 7-phosphate isomerase [Paludibacteraceae bacterium]MBQ6791744.1 D-sedoheptulose 7-phosphate isomerase [Paludibacteraceae bacterium]MBQ6985069.1 D-sedoheptulose 7-phosphate isomerase [Paludibacteraceae bacterium]
MKNMDTIIRSIEDSIATKQQILNNSRLLETIQAVAAVMVKALREGKRILWCGNGGSAADAQHLAAELSGRFYYDRPPLNSEALHCNTSYLTAVANDYGYDLIYSRMIDGACHPGDVLVGISTSGNSKNICNAFRKAKQLGVITVALTGSTGGEMKDLSDFLLNVPSDDTPRIQESHIMLGHIICELVEAEMFPRE